MLSTAHSQWRVKTFIKHYHEGRLNLAPAFQRRSVWTQSDRRRLIISVFDGIPLPTVYLYKRKNTVTGFVEHDVIDGKQRLETLLLFANEGPLVEDDDEEWLRFKSDLDDRAAIEWRYWEDLAPSHQKEFRDTIIPVIVVEGQLSEVAELFVSINSTGKKLTGQEKRHAFYESSNVLKAATQLAEAHRDYFSRHGVMSKAQMNRMLHVEFATELLMYSYNGTHMNKKAKLDAVIRGDTLEGDRLKASVKDVSQVLGVVDVILPNLKATRFRRRADFYTLVTLLSQLKAESQVIAAHWSQRNELAGELLTEFGLGVEQVSELSGKAQSVPKGYADHIKYLATVKEGTDSAQQRIKRASILRDRVLAGVFDTKDVTRTFNEQQRRILWNLSHDKECAICGKPIAKWGDMHADHVQAYVHGGSTTLGNGSITHKTCNLQKGSN